MNSDNQTPLPHPASPNHSWTKRWVELRPHAEQLRLWNDEVRFKIVPAGRRSGKTELAKRRLAEHLFRKTWHGQPGRYFACAPTRDQAKRIWWDDLKALVPKAWRTVSESELWIRTTRGSMLFVVGLDKPDRIEGTPWDGGAIDELATCKSGIWDANIRPALADRRGWCWLIGVPDMYAPGQVDYERMLRIAKLGSDPEWRAYQWPSADILPESEVESARRRMDAKMFRQEYEGAFEVAGGRACPDFDEGVHVRPIAYDPALPLCWSLDFNINPNCSIVCQHVGGEVRAIAELALADCRTEIACDEFLSLAQRQGWNLNGLCVYGDPAGNARKSSATHTDWQIVKNKLAGIAAVRMKVGKDHDPIRDTINAVNGRLKNAAGEVHTVIDPACRHLADDLRSAMAGTDFAEQHMLAAWRYFVAWEYPIRSTAPVQPGYVGII